MVEHLRSKSYQPNYPTRWTTLYKIHTERFLNTFLIDEADVDDPVLWDRVGSGDEPRLSSKLENTLLTLNTEDDTCGGIWSFIIISRFNKYVMRKHEW